MSNEQSLGRYVSTPEQNQSASWSGGWYVFEDGNVVGPLGAKETFSRSEKTTSGQMRMVSRKGFTQWYPIQDFAAIHAMAGRYSDELARASSMTQSVQNNFVVGNQIGSTRTEQQTATHNISVVQRELNTSSSSPVEALSVGSTVYSDAATSGKKLSAKAKKRLLEDERRNRRFAEKKSAESNETNRTTKTSFAPSMEQQYLQVSSRLRLGIPASPVARAFVYTPLTLGLYWWPWLSKTAEEVNWHLNGASRMNFILPMWMSVIPGVHLILAFFVARMVRQMEEQNGYHTVSPALATILAIFPPFYMMMIQSAINRHWRLHVYNTMTKQ